MDQARSREQPGATGFNNPSIKHDKQVIELEKKMKQADSKIRKNIEEVCMSPVKGLCLIGSSIDMFTSVTIETDQGKKEA